VTGSRVDGSFFSFNEVYKGCGGDQCSRSCDSGVVPRDILSFSVTS